MHIDHVIYAVADLAEGAHRVRDRVGLAAVPGGRHEGLGTANTIVPLGVGYLELVTVIDASEAADSTFGRWATATLTQLGDGAPMGWAVAVDDVEPVARRLGTAVETIARDGLRACHTGMMVAAADPAFPFFIARDPGVPDPGTATPAHLSAPRGIAAIEVGGDPAALSAWLGEPDALAALGIRVVAGPPGLHTVTLGGDPQRPLPSLGDSR